ncbi:MAG: immunity 26/phosphotriesterase HocA family protein [Betaproteobacteria bacterium]
MVKFQTGDIFTFKLSTDEYMCGRIMLDIKKQCVSPKLLPPDSPLYFFNGSLLLEIYKSTATQPVIDNSEILIPGIFLDSDSLKYGIWSIIGHQDVNPEEVEFPEALISHGLRAQFLRGEVALNIDLKEEELKKINVSKTKKPSGILGEICLYQLGRADEITNSWVHSIEVFNLNSSDLRFSQHRSEIYRLLGEKENQSYFEMSSRLGYNIQRFYDKKK